MSMSAITNTGQVGFDKLNAAYQSKPVSAGAGALKGSMEVHEMVHQDLSQMMREVQPHLGQNLDVEA